METDSFSRCYEGVNVRPDRGNKYDGAVGLLNSVGLFTTAENHSLRGLGFCGFGTSSLMLTRR